MDIDEARRMLYDVLRRLCIVRYAGVVVLPSIRGCRVSIRGSRLRVVLDNLSGVEPSICVDSLVEDSLSRGSRVLDAILSIVIGLVGTVAVVGEGLGAVLGAAAVLVMLASWLHGRRRRGRIDAVLEARRIDGVSERLYEDIANLLGHVLREAREKCSGGRVCKIPLSNEYRLRCEQFLARYPYLETPGA